MLEFGPLFARPVTLSSRIASLRSPTQSMALASFRGLQGQSPEEAKETISHLRQSLRQLVGSDRGPHWKILHTLLGDTLSECIQEEAVFTHGQIAAPALRRMSKECWCSTWSLLCLRDKISVTHVCTRWRALALDMPSLWATLDFHSSRGSYTSTSRDATAVHMFPRFLLSSRVLERSCALPLHLSIHLEESWSDIDCIQNLAACLITHSHRIATVKFHLDFKFELINEHSNAMVVRAFLGQIPFLPTLESLIVHHTAGSQSYPAFLPDPVNLPALRRLAVPDFSPPRVGHLPSVRHLHCTYSGTPQLVAFLKLCPGLRSLDITMDNTFTTQNGTVDRSDALRRLLSPIDRLHVHNIRAASEEKAPALFHHVSLTELMLHYGPYTFSFDAFRIFEDIAHPTDVECRIECGRTILKTRDSSQPQRSRGLSFLLGGHALHSEPAALQMWSRICARQLSTVVVDIHLFAALMKGLPDAPALRKLTVILPLQYDVEDIPQAFNHLEERRSILKLQLVHFKGEREFSPRVVSALALTTLLRCLNVGRNSQHLRVHVEHLKLLGKLDDDICTGGLTVVYHSPRNIIAM